jgi:hypothetical protein
MENKNCNVYNYMEKIRENKQRRNSNSKQKEKFEQKNIK